MRANRAVFVAMLAACLAASGQTTSLPPKPEIDTGTFTKPIKPDSGPAAKITGPTEVKAGDLAVMRSDGSAGTLKWIVVPGWATERCMEGRNGELAFACSTPGLYSFVLVAFQVDKIAYAVHDLKNGGSPPPVPPDPKPPGPSPPVPPDPKPPGPTPPPDPSNPFAALQQASHSGAMQVAESIRKQYAGKLGSQYKAIASSILAGVYGSVQEIREKTREQNHDLLGLTVQDWMPWAAAVEKELMLGQGKLTSYGDFAKAWDAIGAGLEAAQ